MTPHLAPWLILVPLMALAIWRRVRTQFGLQPIRRRRMQSRIAVFAAIGVLMALAGMHDMRLLEGLLGGVAVGGTLGFVGLRLTRFEHGADGSDGYVPNPWIGALLTVLLLARLAWRLLMVMPQMETLQAGSHPPPTIGNSPLTSLMFGLLVGYYVVYFSGLLIHHRRLQRAMPGA